MKIIDKNTGTKVAYEVSGNKITFGDDEQILIAGPSKYFVANIYIPAKQYDDDGKAVPFSMDNVTLELWALIEEV